MTEADRGSAELGGFSDRRGRGGAVPLPCSSMEDHKTISPRCAPLSLLLLFAVVGADAPGETVIGVHDSELVRFRIVEVVGDLSHPWGMAFLPNGAIIVTERSGTVKLVQDGRSTDIQGAPAVAANGQGGLLDVALHPEFERNRLVYFTYSARDSAGFGTRVGRAPLDGQTLELFEVLFSMEEFSTATHHFGSRMAFGEDGTLYFTIGDRGDRNRAPDLNQHAGKVLRINDDGGVPQDNPFVGQEGVRPEIFSYGHRNPQGIAVDPATGTVWEHEHGPRGGDEVNIIRPGANYGWPEITYGREYSGAYIAPDSKDGLEQPVIHWTPSIAPSGLAFYSADHIPEWKGNLFAGALAGKELRRIVVNDREVVHQERLLVGVVGRIRDVSQGPDGNIWILTDESPGSLIRIEPAT